MFLIVQLMQLYDHFVLPAETINSHLVNQSWVTQYCTYPSWTCHIEYLHYPFIVKCFVLKLGQLLRNYMCFCIFQLSPTVVLFSFSSIGFMHISVSVRVVTNEVHYVVMCVLGNRCGCLGCTVVTIKNFVDRSWRTSYFTRLQH